MATKSTRADRGAELAIRASAAIGRELRTARIAAGISETVAAAAGGLSQAQASRLERGKVASPTVDQISRLAVVVGLVLSLKLYPAGAPLRDVGHLALIARLAACLAGVLRVRREVPLPLRDDSRAWDAKIDGRGPSCAVEAEVHLHDVQAPARRIALKLRDDPTVDRVILLVARSAHNRRVLRERREALRAQSRSTARPSSPASGAARSPPVSGVLML